ncbi:DNA polymerase subunit gamma-1-like isoform X1 [Eriocheir sinensis]|uniref:DNA polymerase subunit gamma-1-like isoform X1 n=2 Tax=Eriocheir sinensis TaxID=95602 RepID=UPI0021C9EB2F|nr:DNA polymerase subunit gamma-1-like isoform X1 [Eriocheir sinensis]
MLRTRKLSRLSFLMSHAWASNHCWLPLSYCKMHFIRKKHKSSKVVKYIQYKKEDIKSEQSKKEVNKIPNKVSLEFQGNSKSYKTLKTIPPVSQEKSFARVPIETAAKTEIEQEECDDVPKIQVASVGEVLEKVAELYNENRRFSTLQFAESKMKNPITGNQYSGKGNKIRIIQSQKNDHGKIPNNNKKKIVKFSNARAMSGDTSVMCHGNSGPVDTVSENHMVNQIGNDPEIKEENNSEFSRTTTSTDDLDKPVSEQEFHNIRRNPLGIQMLSEGIYNQLFKEVTNEGCEKEDLERTKEHLQTHGLWNKIPSVIPSVEFELPEIEGNDLDQHFRVIAENQCSQYKELLNTLVEDVPSLPNKWEFAPGWTRYHPDGSCSSVDYPECSAIVFDVEVCVTEGNQPTMATAVSNKYWYSWCSEALINPDVHFDGSEIRMEELIPLETSSSMNPVPSHSGRVVVGHNVSYDRLRVREQYLLKETPLRFVDTMSLHIAVSGLVSEQRALLMKNKGEKKIRLPWMSVGCQNSLVEVYKFYCRPEKGLEKSTRDVFVDGTLSDVREDFQNLMSYCATDVTATQKVLAKLLPLFYERFPHPVTFSGMLEMGLTFLPVTKNWEKYIEASEVQYHQVERQLNEELVKQVQASLGSMKNKEYENDPWLWSLDWAQPKARVKKLPGYPNWYRKLCARTGEREGTPEPENMSTSLQIVPKILRLTWNGFPLHHERKFGWGYLKPVYPSFKDIPQSEWDSYAVNNTSEPVFPVKALYDICNENVTRQSTALQDISQYDENLNIHDLELGSKNKGPTKKTGGTTSEEGSLKDIGIPGVGFVPLPHKDGAGCRVGNPLAKDFLGKIEDGTLTSHLGDVAKLVLETSKSLSYWKNNRDRILSQMVVWNDHSVLPHEVTSHDAYTRENKYGIIVPMVVSAGTITRRAVERTWMTASNAYADRIGSELKAMVEAPPGYKFVGADVDSQELWIASLLGDAYFTGEHGATALGWMTLQGKKSDGTDMHSHTARSAGISRDHAKVINYGRIYGAGLRFIQRLLKQYNPKLSDQETKRKAEHLFAVTKGEKGWYLNEVGEQLALDIGHPVPEEPLPRRKITKLLWQARESNYGASFSEIVETPPVWIGGSESHMFNCLEAIARCEEPKTPVLGARMTRALEPYWVDNQFMTSRVNWVVQSSAVDYLHIMLVCMRWLFTKYGISGRFCISIHDEVRYLVAEGDCHRAALALQITNLLTRAYFASRLGFKDLPQSVAFFSGVDIDQVLRKEPHMDCVTPSNPQGLMKGYSIKPGLTLDIHEIIKSTNGKLTKADAGCCEEAAESED